jgi:hypothetical protein
MTNGNEGVQSKESIPDHPQLSLSDQLYRQSKIDEENRRLKKKSKSDVGGSGKKGKKSSKKSDLTTIDDYDDDIYPTVKVTRGGELPEGITESGHEDNEDDLFGKKKKKYDPHRALNIDLNEKSAPPKEANPPPPPPPPPVSTEKPKKSKKKKIIEKRERSDYKELVSPADDEEKRETSTLPPAVEEKPKKKKTKEKKPLPPTTTVDANNSAPLLLDILSDDINPIHSSNQQFNEQDAFKLAAQSDNLIIVS